MGPNYVHTSNSPFYPNETYYSLDSASAGLELLAIDLGLTLRL